MGLRNRHGSFSDDLATSHDEGLRRNESGNRRSGELLEHWVFNLGGFHSRRLFAIPRHDFWNNAYRDGGDYGGSSEVRWLKNYLAVFLQTFDDVFRLLMAVVGRFSA